MELDYADDDEATLCSGTIEDRALLAAVGIPRASRLFWDDVGVLVTESLSGSAIPVASLHIIAIKGTARVNLVE
jgi:hypothetical protein